MNLIAFVLAAILCGALSAGAETYSWTDEQGVVSFTDDPTRIPLKYRTKVNKGEDITIQNPKVQQELKAQEERARQEEMNRPPVVVTPDYVPPPLPPPVAVPSRSESDELPPGRTKSQRIRDNIERREAEERARQAEEKK